VVRVLHADDLEELQRSIPFWNASEYRRRLAAQDRLELVQLVAWANGIPIGKAMVLFPAHEEYSISAAREGCAEVRDLFVAEDYRRRGVATALMDAAERASAQYGFETIGLGVAVGEEPAEQLYESLGYRHAHGPFIGSTVLRNEHGEGIVVGDVMTYLTKSPAAPTTVPSDVRHQ